MLTQAIPKMNRRQILAGFAATPLLMGIPALRVPVSAQGAMPFVNQLAQGTDLMPRVPVCWRAIQMDAKMPATAPMLSRTLAFLLAWTGPMTVTNPDAGRTDHLNQEQATFGAQEQRQKRASAASHPVTYLGWELVVASEAESPGTIGDSKVIALTDPFTAPQGRTHMALYQGTVSTDKGVDIHQGGFPIALFALNDQAVITSDNGHTTTLDRGDAAVITSNATITAGPSARGNTMVAAALFDQNGQAMTKPGAPASDSGERKVVVFKPADFKGAYTKVDEGVYQRSCVALYGNQSGYGVATVRFFLDQPGSGGASLTLIGLDDENSGPNPMVVTLNDTTIYRGNSRFDDWPEGGEVPWKPMDITFDGGIVVGGYNTLMIANRSHAAAIGRPPYILLAGGSLDIVTRSPF